MYNIIYFQYGREVIDSAGTLKEAKYLLKEYRTALKTQNVKIQRTTKKHK